MMSTLLKPSRLKIIVAILLFILSFILAFVYSKVAQSSANYLEVAASIFFPLHLALFFDGILRVPMQDVMVCRVPGCLSIIQVLTVLVSGMIYYILACFIDLIFRQSYRK